MASSGPATQTSIAQEGLVHCVSGYLSGTMGLAMQLASVKSLTAIATANAPVQSEIGEAGLVPHIVKFLYGTVQELKVAATDCICSLIASHEGNQDRALRCEGTKALVEIAVKASPEQRALATVAVTASQDTLPDLLDLISTGSPATKEFVVKTLVDWVFGNVEVQDRIAREGGIPILVAACKSGTAKLKELAVTLIGRLNKDHPRIQRLVVEADGTLALLELIRSGTPLQKELASTTLGTLVVGHRENQTEAALGGAISELLMLARHGTNVVHVDHRPLCAAVRGEILAVEQHRPRGCQKCAAMTALGCLVGCHSDNQQQALDAGAAPLVLQVLMTSSTPQQKAAAAKLVAALCERNLGVQSALGSAGIIPPLLKMVESGSELEQEAASRALAALCAGHSGNRQLIASGGGTTAVDDLSKSAHPSKGAASLARLQIRPKFHELSSPRLTRAPVPVEHSPLHYLM